MKQKAASMILVVAAVFSAICFIFPDHVGLLGYSVATVFFGLFGVLTFLVPVLMLLISYFLKKDAVSGAFRYRYLFAIVVLISGAMMVHTFHTLFAGEKYSFSNAFAWTNMRSWFVDGREYLGGGFIGGVISAFFVCLFGYPGTLVFGFLFLIVMTLALFGLPPKECVRRCIAFCRRRFDRNPMNTEESTAVLTQHPEASDDEEYSENIAEASVFDGEKTEIFENTDDIQTEDDLEEDESDVQENTVSETVSESVPSDVIEDPTPIEDSGITELAEDAATADENTNLTENTDPTEAELSEEDSGFRDYEFPSVELLQPAEKISRDENESRELRENADKIIETLESFHVHVSISNVSKGPTVTRYELEPAAGTRVRSILNLLDDIALSLATSGVRSDGIIAGKGAIGIEVPNQTVKNVYIRELIEDKRFEDASSRLTACLGKDVSGDPVYLDIAKMPHLLIAGATGMGKSVCINSLLVSLLYKARPDEVKLILIDPKKVELNIYNGIPHLLVPVVFDPKKAAGALHWAVTEMERRFELIESKNTRNIAQYNAAIADDPNREFLPQIVIVIDELADLMLSAPDDVEASICRLAQKARAAGMHLIIGTQRPSVDVITGLIKANIPSRIAFTVASQIDSRTIIDTQGAEKLIGRGDMLYSPVGASKPIRIQGSFVSETEIDQIVGDIRAQRFGIAYSDDIMTQINRAAELCGQKKSKSGGIALVDFTTDENDSMLDSAIALAVETGKISTSLIQRRLQLGYGRAAKIIDIMERRGIVSAPDGQRPRTVLITREQYLEMQMNRADRAEAIEDDSL